MPKIADSISLADQSRTDESFGRGGVNMTLGDGATVVQGSGNNRSAPKWLLPTIYSLAVAFGIGWLREDINAKIDQQTLHTDHKFAEKTLHTDARFDRMAERIETAKADILKNRSLVDEVAAIARNNRTAIDRNTTALDALRKDYDRLDCREKNSEGAWVWLFRRDIIYALEDFSAKGTLTQKDYDILKEEIDYYHSLGGNHDISEKWERFRMKIAAQKIRITE